MKWLGLVVALLAACGSWSFGQISTEEAMQRLRERQAAEAKERAEHPATRPAVIMEKTAPAPATEPSVAIATADGVPFPAVTAALVRHATIVSHAKLDDVEKLVCVPPGETGLKIWSADAAAKVLGRRTAGLDPSVWSGCDYFALDVGRADVAWLKLRGGVIEKIVLIWRNARAGEAVLRSNYGAPGRAWQGDRRGGLPGWSIRGGDMERRAPGAAAPPMALIADAWPMLEDAEQAAAEREPDPIKRAMAKGELAVGMTLEQANQSLKQPGELVEEDGPTKTYRWAIYRDVVHGTSGSIPYGASPRVRVDSVLSRVIEGDFMGGKLVRYRR